LGNNTDVQFEFAGLGLKHKANLGFNVNRIDFTHINNKPYDDFSSEKNLHESVYWSDAGPTEKDLSTETYQYALYADYLLDVSQQFLVVAGLRSDWVNFERKEEARQFNNGNNREASTLKNDFQTTSWRLGAVYKPLDSMSLYLQYSEASDALGHIISTSRSDLKLSEGTQVELGLKQSLLNDQLQYTVALFNINQTNLVDKAQAGASERQVGEQASKGVEWEVFYLPHESIDITANAAFYEARYKNFTDYSDNRPYNIPEQTANLWMNWRPVDDWQLSGGLRHVGMRYTDESNTTEMPAYQVYDAAIAWQYNDATRFTLRGKNLSDSLDYVLSSYGDQWILGEGRQFELSMNYQL
jgi:iron complex outermembrane receptor protein